MDILRVTFPAVKMMEIDISIYKVRRDQSREINQYKFLKRQSPLYLLFYNTFTRFNYPSFLKEVNGYFINRLPSIIVKERLKITHPSSIKI